MPEPRDQPILFEHFPGLKAIPWMSLAPLQTPVENLATLGNQVGCHSIYIKRDDLTSPLYGGNKVRKFEFFFADFLAKKRKRLITLGGTGSNHCLASTIFVKHLNETQNLNIHSVIGLTDQPVTEHVRHNLLLDQYFGAEFVYAHGYGGILPKLMGYYLTHRGSYFMWPGASTAVGTLGFVNAAFELKQQVDAGEMPEPDKIFCACGSAGTSAGLALGCQLAGLKTKVIGAQVSMAMFASTKSTHNLMQKTLALLQAHDHTVPTVDLSNIFVDPNYYGGTYGWPTRRGIDAIAQVKDLEGIILEVTYTGKAFACLLDYLQKDPACKDETLLFWNTYNSRDFSDTVSSLDYHALPKNLHWIFEQDLPDLQPREA
ncbi:MAG TPA: pyridoxal-phosphate dependent enzyme [Candidatus Lokiarchaeia archaeon]|nr:pyridoxal-phosphate dependent enzyme [Candidatus Lokiarchaeia archaeon]